MVKVTVSGTNSTVAFEYTAVTAQITNILAACAEYLWDQGYGNHGTEESVILFTSLTNAEKLALVDLFVKRTIINAANTFKSEKAVIATRITEEASKYSL